jgi:hypothetical protein
LRNKIFLLSICLIWVISLKSQDSIMKTPKFHTAFVSGFYILQGDGNNFGMGIAGAYYKKVFGLARWNYEGLNSFSILGGYSFSDYQHAFKWEIIPMGGVAMGNFTALLPALRFNLAYKKFTLTSETEYAISLNEKNESYFFIWSELRYLILPWLQTGIAAQRSRLYTSGRNVDHGFLINTTMFSKLNIGGYIFDTFDKNDRFYMLSMVYFF